MRNKAQAHGGHHGRGWDAKAFKDPAEEPEEDPEEITPAKRFKQALDEKVQQELGEWKDQVLVKAFDGGVRIELVDSDSSPMFHKGRSDMTPEGKKVLKVIGENVLTSGSKVALEGHTDAFNYASKQYSNWELSTERASAARKRLEFDGLPPERLLRVAGFAATEPLIKDDPFDPRNRRISIVVFEPQPLLIERSGKTSNASQLQAASRRGAGIRDEHSGRSSLSQPLQAARRRGTAILAERFRRSSGSRQRQPGSSRPVCAAHGRSTQENSHRSGAPVSFHALAIPSTPAARQGVPGDRRESFRNRTFVRFQETL